MAFKHRKKLYEPSISDIETYHLPEEDQAKTVLAAMESLLLNSAIERLDNSVAEIIKKTLSEEPATQVSGLYDQLSRSLKHVCKPFLLLQQEQGIIIYGDPDEPNNSSKQILYRWNPETKRWNIEPGKNAKCVITSDSEQHMIKIINGAATTHGKSSLFDRVLSPTQTISNDSLLASLAPHHLFTFPITPSNAEDVNHFLSIFSTEKCNAARSRIVGSLLEAGGSLLETVASSHDYSDNGIIYQWYQTTGGGYLGLAIDANKRITCLIPEQGLQHDHLIALCHKDHGKGYAGGHFLHVSAQGKARLVQNSPVYSASLSPSVQRLTQEALASHLSKAGISLKPMSYRPTPVVLSTPGATVTPTNLSSHLPKPQPSTFQCGSLPSHIRITGLDDAHIYGLHCSFRETHCLGENGLSFAANVYVLKRYGSDLNQDKSDAVILQITDEGKVSILSGFNEKDHYAKGKVTINQHGKSYTSTFGTKGEYMDHVIDTHEGSPFQELVIPHFMCVRKCLEHYSEDNKRLIETAGRTQSRCL